MKERHKWKPAVFPGARSSKVITRLMSPSRLLLLFVLTLATAMAGLPGTAQTSNQRLILKDGSYQIVTRYQRSGDRVRYFSAERSQWEEIPEQLVDWAATDQYAKTHVPGAHAIPQQAPQPAAQAPVSPAIPEAAAIDQEEQAERARTPDVRPGLRLPDEEGIWALDTFHDAPELVALLQNNGVVNRQTGHNILRTTLNPLGGVQQAITIPGSESKVRLHVSEPDFYVSLTTEDGPAEASAVVVETHGGGSLKDKNISSASSQYAIVRARSNFKRDTRTVSGVKIAVGGKVTQTEDVIPTTAVVLPGKHWLKLTPQQPLTIGEYALMEVITPGEVNLSVWDFRVDPQSAENKNAIMPLKRQ